MKVDILLGLQWGDEGKGKVVDVLTPRYDVVARFQGGPNAGHTLEFEGQKYVLRSIPSGIFQGDKVNIIGNGVVLDPALFKAEAEALEASGHNLKERLHISKKAHLILPTHRILDAAVTGLGGNSCGQGGPLEQDCVKAGNYFINLLIRPINNGNFVQTAKVAVSGDTPLLISRSRDGLVSIDSGDKVNKVMYSLNHSKISTLYTAPFNLREGGTVTAFYVDNPQISVTATFSRIESVPLKVIYASSQEVGEGDASYLVDGDSGTMWHTMYSVTVAKYPHWVDFDAGETKMIRGFVYLPRQDGGVILLTS